MENTVQKNYKRQDRGVSPEVARKISNGLRSYNATHPRSDEWKKKQSEGLKNYWQQIPPKQSETDNGEETTWDDIVL